MDDVQKIRQQLWVSMDMTYVRRYFIGLVAVAAWALVTRGSRLSEPSAMPVIVAVVEGPFFVFLAYRTWKIFRRAEHYIIQEAVLDSPFGGWGRGAIRFTVTVIDSEGCRQRVDTHGIFSTRGILAPNLQDYVNRKARVAYNEETGTLVVIG